jgi:predicted  nucleic acid-binding Zn-ribbon protein
MNKTLTKKDNPRFDIINRYNVTIISLRNQLKQAIGIDELTSIASKIIELEHQILVEKSAGYAQLEEEKKKIESKVDKLRRELKRAEDDLNRIDNSIDLKMNGYRKALQSKIDSLNDEYNEVILSMEND